MSGYLFLVVGPSGSGKDTLLNAARDFFADQGKVHFPKRYITRDQDAGGEDHIPVSPDKFELLRLTAQFAFNWDAHGLHYGIPKSIDDYLAQGQNVVVNVSRAIIPYVREHYNNMYVLSIAVNRDELERRLKARGRETEDDIQRRLERAVQFNVDGDDVIDIDNSADLETSVNQFINTLATISDIEKLA